MSRTNLKLISLFLTAILIVTIIPMNVFAEESSKTASCDEGMHNFTVEKYDENGHWLECSICGEMGEVSSHYYDESGDIICNGCLYERSPIEEISIDKALLSEGETATVTVKTIRGYSAKSATFYKPITNNPVAVALNSNSDGTYKGTFTVNDQTESGFWKVKYITIYNNSKGNSYIYNSDTYKDKYYKKYDFTALNFEVIGTNADVALPVIESYSVDKSVVSAGERLTVTVKATDEHLPPQSYAYFRAPTGKDERVILKKVDTTGLYQGTITINSDSETGIWKPYYLIITDTNGNKRALYNSNVDSLYSKTGTDLSSLNFEVVTVNKDEKGEDAETFIVKFIDGYGNTLSTQRVNKGESAVEPTAPTNELYLFDGWDTDFTNVRSDITVTATWKLNPNVVYDKEAHIGKSFSIKVYSTANQNYTVKCENAEFTSKLVSTGMIFSDQLYYVKTYEIKVNASGSYLFYVKGSSSSNTLTYKVRIIDHSFNSEWTVIQEATCTQDGIKCHKCSACDAVKDETTIEKHGHNYSNEWTVTKEATCTEDGIKCHKCNNCDASADETTIEKLGHNYSNEWTFSEPMTCTEDGIKFHKCTRCDSKADITVEKAPGHYYGDLITVEPTCDDAGYTEQICIACGFTKRVKIPAKGHTYKVSVTKATVSKNGATVTKCSVCGKVKLNVTIAKISTVKLSKASFTYNGKVQKPTVTVKDLNGKKLKQGTDYTVKYSSGCKNVGKYTVTVTLKGNYSGTKKLTFNIVPKGTSISNVTAGKKQFTIKWKKQSIQASGYEIQYSTSKNMKNAKTVTVNKNSATSKTVKGLKASKTYYVRIRTYKAVSGKKIYSGWSGVVNIKTK